MELLPIGQRVTHFGGEIPGTHGKGTIVGYNGVEPKNYGQSNPGKAAEMIGQVDDPQAKAALASGLVNSMYDKPASIPTVIGMSTETNADPSRSDYATQSTESHR
jgi:hypothetical protein